MKATADFLLDERQQQLESVAFLHDFDWRFLMPTPPGGSFRRLVLLGGTADMAAAIVELGIAAAVSQQPTAPGAADAVIRLRGAREDLAAAARCLEPGGVLYGEVERPSRLSLSTLPRRVQRSLERAGLTHVQLYWCMPNFEHHEAFVPLGSSPLMEWYLANLSRLRVWLNPALAALARLGAGAFGAAIRSYAVTGVAGGAAAAPPSVLGHTDLPAELRVQDPRLLLFAPPQRRVVLLPFDGDSAEPLAALKLSRNRKRNDRAVTEQQVLADIYHRVAPSMRPSLPRPFGCLEWHGLIATIEGGVQGRMLSDRNTGWRRDVRHGIEDLRRVVGWLIDFQPQTEVRRVRWGDSLLHQGIPTLIADYDACVSTTAAERTLFDELRTRSEMVADAMLPLVRGHGDFHGGNIFRHGDRISVIDWVPAVDPPWSGAEACPLVDMLRFVVDFYAHEQRCWSESAKARSLDQLFVHPDQRDPLVRAIHEELARYTSALNLDPRLVPIVLVQMYIAKAGLFYSRRLNKTLAHQFSAFVRVLAGDPDHLFGRYAARSQEVG